VFAQLSGTSDWLRDHEKSPRVQSASAQNETEHDQVAECRPLWPDVEKSMTMHDQTAAQLNASTILAASDPTSLTSAYPYKMSADDTSCLTLHLSKRLKCCIDRLNSQEETSVHQTALPQRNPSSGIAGLAAFRRWPGQDEPVRAPGRHCSRAFRRILQSDRREPRRRGHRLVFRPLWRPPFASPRRQSSCAMRLRLSKPTCADARSVPEYPSDRNLGIILLRLN
jgi:hypothetical protein